jgi:hypothetical protein
MHELLDLVNRVAALERRFAGMVKHGRVAEVNAEEAWVRLDLGEGDNGRLLSPKIPYAQFAGALKVHTPPSEGQQMTWLAPGGDSQQSFAVPLTWSDRNESPSTSQDENVVTYGDVRITLDEHSVLVEVGGFALRISGAGLAMEGGGVGHNGRDIGSTHRHPEVMTGPSKTGLPVESGPVP